jgi:hypothetical protein
MGGVRTDCHRLIRAAVSGRRSRHHAKDKQRFVASVAAYDSLPGHHFTQVKSRLRGGASAALKSAFKDVADRFRVPLPRRDASRHATV